LNETLSLFSALSFLAYGTGCFTSRYLASEFMRYGFSRQRRLIGMLQILGAVALIAGWWLPPLGKAGAGGLALMMLVATPGADQDPGRVPADRAGDPLLPAQFLAGTAGLLKKRNHHGHREHGE